MNNRKKVVLVTHTGSDMPLAEAEALGIYIIPDKVIFGDKEYRNMTEITAEEFYEKLNSAAELPTSSQPSVGDFVKTFQKAAEDADEVLCLMITSKMSGCYQTAVSAAQMVISMGLTAPVYVYDTQQCSHGMAQMVRAAAAMAQGGLSAHEIMDELTLLQHRMGVFFVLDSLENAKKGGRVGAVTAHTVNMLGIKPLLMFSDGLVREFGISRNFDSGINKIVNQFVKNGDRTYPVTVFHADASERAEALREKILQSVPEAIIRIETVGPVIGIYTGSGCAGIAFTEKDGL